jgi:RimJ/RimL family protein N-acetyltransferase
MGWFVVPELQGRGMATAAARLLIARLPRLGGPRVVFAFPSADNHPSNAICRRLGFTLAETAASEYPPGSGRQLQVNVWKLELPSGDQKVS